MILFFSKSFIYNIKIEKSGQQKKWVYLSQIYIYFAAHCMKTGTKMTYSIYSVIVSLHKQIFVCLTVI